MNKNDAQQRQRRTIYDRLISGFNAWRFGLVEPVILNYTRSRCEHQYRANQEKPLISVYVPTYNRGQLLIERAVASVLEQTYSNLELIIVGDHCTDNTAELMAQVNDPRICFYNIPKRGYRYPPTAENHWLAGPVVAANQALQMVRGQWIARIDDDDTWTPDHLEVLLRFAQQGNYEFVSAAYITERHGKRIVVDLKNETPRIGGTQTWLYRSYLRFFKYNLDCWRKSWNRVNDTDLQDRMFKAGVRMGFLDQVVAFVLPRPGEVTVGLEAYRLTEQAKVEHFKFDN